MTRPVTHVSAHYLPYLGGLERVIAELVHFRQRRGLPVKVVTCVDSASRSSGPEEDPVRRLRAVEVAHTSIAPGLPLALCREAPGTILHLHVAQAWIPESVMLAHLVRRTPYVAHFHIDAAPSGPAGVLLRAYQPLFLGTVLRHAGAVVVFTDEQRELLVDRYRLQPARVQVVANGVGAEWFDGPRERRLHRPIRLLFVGRLAVQKKVDLLLRALHGIAGEYTTTVVGDGELRPELEAEARRLGLPGVTFAGRVDGDDLRRLYADHDVLVLPSDREGMPLVLLEAMAMGLGVVAADIPGNRQLLAGISEASLFEVGSADALRAAIIAVGTDPEVYARSTRQLTARAATRSWDVVGEQMETVYRTLGAA